MDGDALFPKGGMLKNKLGLAGFKPHKSGGLSGRKITKFQGFSGACFYENTNRFLIRSEIGQSDLGCPLGLRPKQKEKNAEKIHPKIKRSEK
jgi:hypothetical protein